MGTTSCGAPIGSMPSHPPFFFFCFFFLLLFFVQLPFFLRFNSRILRLATGLTTGESNRANIETVDRSNKSRQVLDVIIDDCSGDAIDDGRDAIPPIYTMTDN
jgi:hypothetical protein